jgi:oligopeptide transport system substrate-binding protein
MTFIGKGLYHLAADDTYQLALAESFTRSADGLTLTFKIRDTRWSDGSPLTAHDFVYAWRRLADPTRAAPYRWLLSTSAIVNAQDVLSGKKPLETLGVKALDDRTLVISLDVPVAYTDALFTFAAFYPLKQSFVEAQGNKFATSPATTLSIGAFVLKTFEPNAELVEYVKNPYFYRADEVKWEGARHQTIKDLQQAVLAYQAGLVDVVPQRAGEQIDLFRGDPELHSELGGRVYYLTPNTKTNRYLANYNVRRAFALSIDRQALADNILRNGSIPAEYLVARGLVRAPDDKTDFRDGGAGVGNELHFNRAEALRSWNLAKQELGFTTLNLTLNTEDAELNQTVSQFLQAQLQNLPGLTIRISAMPRNTQVAKHNAGDFELNFHRWAADFPDPISTLDLWLSDQHPVYRNAEYDAILNSASRGELALDLPRRFRELRRAEQIPLRDIATIPLFQSGTSSLIKSNITGVEFHDLGAVNYHFATKSITGIVGR